MTSAGTVTSDSHGLVRQLLDVINTLKCEGEDALFKCLLSPAFIAGLECQNESEQQQVLRYLKTLWDCLNIMMLQQLSKAIRGRSTLIAIQCPMY